MDKTFGEIVPCDILYCASLYPAVSGVPASNTNANPECMKYLGKRFSLVTVYKLSDISEFVCVEKTNAGMIDMNPVELRGARRRIRKLFIGGFESKSSMLINYQACSTIYATSKEALKREAEKLVKASMSYERLMSDYRLKSMTNILKNLK